MVQEFISFPPNVSLTQTPPTVIGVVPVVELEIPPPKDFLAIGQKSFEIQFHETSDLHEIIFDIETYLTIPITEIKIALENWYHQKFVLILRTFNEIHGTAIQPDQILPKFMEAYPSFEGNMVTLFSEIAESLGYNVKAGFYESVFEYAPFLRFINISVTTKKGEFVHSSRQLHDLYLACVDKKIEISKEKIRDQYPKLFENKGYKNFTQKEAQPINVILIDGKQINLYEGLRLIKTSLFIDVYDTAEQAEIATFRSFVCRLTNLLKRNIAVLRNNHSETPNVASSFQYLRKIDGGKMTLDEMVKEVYRQSIATQLTIDDLSKPEVKTLKTLEKFIEKEKSIPEAVFKVYEQITLTAQILRVLGAFRGDVQKSSYIGLLKNLLAFKTGNLFKKPTSIKIEQSVNTIQFLKEVLQQTEVIKKDTLEINNAIFKANQLKRIIDNHTGNSSLNNFFHLKNSHPETFEDHYKQEIFNCLCLPESEMNKQLDKIRDEFSGTIKDFKDQSKKSQIN
jgi:hypothetical protein